MPSFTISVQGKASTHVKAEQAVLSVCLGAHDSDQQVARDKLQAKALLFESGTLGAADDLSEGSGTHQADSLNEKFVEVAIADDDRSEAGSEFSTLEMLSHGSNDATQPGARQIHEVDPYDKITEQTSYHKYIIGWGKSSVRVRSVQSFKAPPDSSRSEKIEEKKDSCKKCEQCETREKIDLPEGIDMQEKSGKADKPKKVKKRHDNAGEIYAGLDIMQSWPQPPVWNLWEARIVYSITIREVDVIGRFVEYIRKLSPSFTILPVEWEVLPETTAAQESHLRRAAAKNAMDQALDYSHGLLCDPATTVVAPTRVRLPPTDDTDIYQRPSKDNVQWSRVESPFGYGSCPADPWDYYVPQDVETTPPEIELSHVILVDFSIKTGRATLLSTDPAAISPK